MNPTIQTISAAHNTRAAAVPHPQSAGGAPKSSAHVNPRPPTSLEVAQLLQLFQQHNGLVPGRELDAEGFKIGELLERGLIARPRAHYDLDGYGIGQNLRKAVLRT